MPNLLDDLFQWAAQQQTGNITSISLAMTSNQIDAGPTVHNLVSYSEGPLYYNPANHQGVFFIAANFASNPDGITQYFNNRRPKGGGFEPGPPFDPEQTDQLDFTINAPLFFSDPYSITIHSSKYGFRFTFNPNFDSATQIITTVNGLVFITISLCDPTSVPRP
jgi:hypothetical protein